MTNARVLVLWNHVGEDIYARWKKEGPAALEWDPEETAVDVGTVEEELHAFLTALREAGYDVDCVNAEDDLQRIMASIQLYQPDVVFNLVEYFNDDEGQEAAIAGLYELLGVEYTGSRGGTLTLCQNKVRTKLLLAGNGLPTPRHMVIETQPLPAPADIGLRYPLIVKPALEDASGGIENDSVVQTYDALVERVRHILEHFEQPALVEEYIDGREIHAAILGNENPEVLPLFEMEFDDSYFYEEDDDSFRPHIISYSAKWDPTTEAFYSMEATCPAELEPALAARIREVALAAFRVAECRDYARVDMRIGPDGEPYILEVNPNPDLALDGAFEMCAAASGRTYGQTLAAIVEQALSRHVVEDEAEDEPVVTDQMLVRHTEQARATDSGRDAA